MSFISNARMKAGATLTAFSLLLTGCFITPGKFESELALSNEGTFDFSYSGEIFFLGLSQLAQMDNQAEEFEANDCYDEETYEQRECTEGELAEQREAWEAGAEARQAKAKEEAQQMAQFLGGIDPSDPEATEELRQLLLRHKGWNKVESKGDGVFDIEYSASGKLSHNLMFPIIEGFPTTNIFVQVVLRDENQVRVNAPGFSSESDAGPMGGMMGAMPGLAAMGQSDQSAEAMENIPTIDGTFTIRTDGEILANNTDEGASTVGEDQVLVWKISPRTQAAPTALIKLAD
ncbi:MAG TPA: hypothetical protein DCS24_08365 [Erythrobacter sp.]|nr:hypothetical protein [Erythrobacter sp.]